jgi:hypothetical protein
MQAYFRFKKVDKGVFVVVVDEDDVDSLSRVVVGDLLV